MGVQLWEGSDIASTCLRSHDNGVYLSLVISHNGASTGQKLLQGHGLHPGGCPEKLSDMLR